VLFRSNITWGKARAAAEYNRHAGHIKYDHDLSPYLYSIPELNYRVLTSAATQNEVEKVAEAAEEKVDLASLKQRVLDKPAAVEIPSGGQQQEKEQSEKDSTDEKKDEEKEELDQSNLPIKKRKIASETKRKPLFV
jgi:hypothetical protein